MSTTRLADIRLLVLSIVLSGGIFAVDLSLPLGVAGGVPCVIVVLLHQYDGSLSTVPSLGNSHWPNTGAGRSTGSRILAGIT